MSHKKLLLFLSISLAYSITVGFYTGYGVFKSYNEYFCRQRRPGDPDYAMTFQPGWISWAPELDLSTVRGDSIITLDGQIVKLDNGDHKVCRPQPDGIDVCQYYNIPETYYGQSYVKEYKVGSNYFTLNCTAYDTGVHLSESDGNFTRKTKGYTADANGFIKEHNFGDSIVVTPSKGEDVWGMNCILLKSPETCEIMRETSNSFFLWYVALMVVLFVSAVCFSMVQSTDFVQLRIIHSLQTALSEMNAPIRFCNPITGKPVFYKKGETVIQLTKIKSNARMPRQGFELDEFEDLDGKYVFVRCGGILIKNKESALFKNLTKSEEAELRWYFTTATMSHKMCVLTEDCRHFLKTKDVIDKIVSGWHFTVGVCNEDGYALGVTDVDVGLIKAQYNLKDSILSSLIEHNKTFFNYFEVKALLLCLGSKMFSWDKPDNVKNSQWKWYTSDFCSYMNKTTGSNYKSQCSWRASKALNKVLSMGLVPIQRFEKEIVVTNVPSGRISFAEEARRLVGGYIKPLPKTREHVIPKKNLFGKAVGEFINQTEGLGKKLVETHSSIMEDKKGEKDNKIEQLEKLKNSKDELCRCLKETLFKYKSLKADLNKAEDKVNKGVETKLNQLNTRMKNLESDQKADSAWKDRMMSQMMSEKPKLESTLIKEDPSRPAFERAKKIAKTVLTDCAIEIVRFDKILAKLKEMEKGDNLQPIPPTKISLREFWMTNKKEMLKSRRGKGKRRGKNSSRASPTKNQLKSPYASDPALTMESALNKVTTGKYDPNTRKRSIYCMSALIRRFILSKVKKDNGGGDVVDRQPSKKLSLTDGEVEEAEKNILCELEWLFCKN